MPDAEPVARSTKLTAAWPFSDEANDTRAEGRVALRAVLEEGQSFRALLDRDDLAALHRRLQGLAAEPVVRVDADDAHEWEQGELREARRADETLECLQAFGWARRPEDEKMVCANASIADASLVLSGCVRGNAVPYTLGAGNGSKGTAMYQMK